MPPFPRICILGGGSAGWMTAAALASKFHRVGADLTLIESDQIGTVGVGEATLPHIRFFNRTLGIDERTFMKSTEATFKLGIEFCDWGKKGDRYIHPFGDYGLPVDGLDFHQAWLKLRQAGKAHRIDDYSFPILAAEEDRFKIPEGDVNEVGSNFGYAYQFDSSLYAKFLRGFSEARGVKRVEGRVVDIKLGATTGHVEALTLENGLQVEADVFVDCSGFRGVLIEQTLETGYDDWSEWLPCNRAVAIPCESHGELSPYTRATARTCGWQWRIPLHHRTGNGHVYCSDFISDDEATAQLLGSLEGTPLADPNQLYFKTGRRKKFWNRNVVSIGLSAGFLEPLESTSIHLIQEGITTLIELFPSEGVNSLDVDEYNRRMGLNFERVRDFLLLHYIATQRDDSEMWRHFRALKLPDSLEERLQAWLSRGHIPAYEFGVFLPPSWLAVMMGQNLMPTDHDPRVDRYDATDLHQRLEAIRMDTRAAVSATPRQADFLAQYGAASQSPRARAAT